MIKKTFFASIILFSISNASYAWFFAPSNPSDCVRKYASQITNKDIADIVILSCYSYFNTEDKSDKKFYQCVIENTYKSKNKTSATVAVVDCRDKHP
jgi:hypothetical protein